MIEAECDVLESVIDSDAVVDVAEVEARPMQPAVWVWREPRYLQGVSLAAGIIGQCLVIAFVAWQGLVLPVGVALVVAMSLCSFVLVICESIHHGRRR